MWSLTELLPHRAPMLLLDEIREVGEEHIVCTYTVSGDSPFVVQGRLEPGGLLETLAQAMAAFVGHRGRLAGGDTIPMGFVVGASSVTFTDVEVRIGDPLVVEAWQRETVGGYGSFDGRVRRGDEVVCEGTLKVYREGGAPASS